MVAQVSTLPLRLDFRVRTSPSSPKGCLSPRIVFYHIQVTGYPHIYDFNSRHLEEVATESPGVSRLCAAARYPQASRPSPNHWYLSTACLPQYLRDWSSAHGFSTLTHIAEVAMEGQS